MTATYEHEGGVTFTSMRENTLFGVLHILRQLDPTLAESLIAKHQQLASAAHPFPNGMDTIREEADRRSRNARAACGGFGLAGNPRDFPYMKALLDASRAGDFGPSIEQGARELPAGRGTGESESGPTGVLAVYVPLPQHSLPNREGTGPGRSQLPRAHPRRRSAALRGDRVRGRPRGATGVAGNPAGIPPASSTSANLDVTPAMLSQVWLAASG